MCCVIACICEAILRITSKKSAVASTDDRLVLEKYYNLLIYPAFASRYRF